MNIANKMPECFDFIEKAAINWARNSETKIYHSLLQAFNIKDNEMIISLLKLINQLIYRAETEDKKASFIARLETQGIFKCFEKVSD